MPASYCGPSTRHEIATVSLVAETAGARLRVTTNLAGDPPGDGSLRYAGLNLDALDVAWGTGREPLSPGPVHARRALPRAKTGVGTLCHHLRDPGRAVRFAGGWAYGPYPQLEDVTADLERIATLGFDTVQLMPRQPYPSYNVDDYGDIDTTYGGRDALWDLVRRARGWGCTSYWTSSSTGCSTTARLATPWPGCARAGCWRSRRPLQVTCSPTRRPASLRCDGPGASTSPTLPPTGWTAHPPSTRSPWSGRGGFAGTVRRSSSVCTPRPSTWPTKAGRTGFARPSWAWWRTSRLTVSASTPRPTTTSPTGRRPGEGTPSTSSTGGVTLFERLRRQLKARFPEVLMFTEPSGVVLRESMDMNYNYDELWLVPALMAEPGAVRVPLSGSQLAAWLDERDATLPADALTCHHLDSHDTFWWPAPGHKWRREQIGLPATRALTWCLALAGGPFMMFTGGEVGMEQDVARLLHLRRQREELRHGGADFSAAELDDEAVFAVLRHHGSSGLLVLVNLSPRATTIGCRLRRGWRAVGAAPGEPLKVELEPYGSALLEVRQ